MISSGQVRRGEAVLEVACSYATRAAEDIAQVDDRLSHVILPRERAIGLIDVIHLKAQLLGLLEPVVEGHHLRKVRVRLVPERGERHTHTHTHTHPTPN